jgi:hypothetical protein
MTESLYVEWGRELVDSALDLIYDPYLATNREAVAKVYAEKLKSDLEKCIVEEWFCANCDRRKRDE